MGQYGTYIRKVVDLSNDDQGLQTAINLTGHEAGDLLLYKTVIEPMCVDRFGFRPTTLFNYGTGPVEGSLGLFKYPLNMICVDLPSAIALYNSLAAAMNAHAADVSQHTTAADTVDFPLAATLISQGDLVGLMAAVNLMQIAYKAHNTDAIKASAWVYHIAQATTHAPANDTAVTTLATTIAKLNDLVAKYNLHDTDEVTHTLAYLHQAYKVLLATIALVDGDLVGYQYVCDVDNKLTKAVAPYTGVAAKGIADLEPGDKVAIELLVEPVGGTLGGVYHPFFCWHNRAETENVLTHLVNRTPEKAAVNDPFA